MVRPMTPPVLMSSGTPPRQSVLHVPPGQFRPARRVIPSVAPIPRSNRVNTPPGGRPYPSPMAEGADGFIETERKYDAGADFALPDLAGLAGVAAVTGPRTYRLRAVYFDTPDLSLAAAQITLRRRTGGTDAGWHLKLPVGVDSRREVHAPLGRGAYQVPAKLAGLVTGWSGGQQLHPIALLATTRRIRRLAGQDGQVLAEIADDLVTGSLPGPAGRAGPGAATGSRRPGSPEWQE